MHTGLLFFFFTTSSERTANGSDSFHCVSALRLEAHFHAFCIVSAQLRGLCVILELDFPVSYFIGCFSSSSRIQRRFPGGFPTQERIAVARGTRQLANTTAVLRANPSLSVGPARPFRLSAGKTLGDAIDHSNLTESQRRSYTHP